MAFRLGPGPVFVYESLAASRRWQYYALRSAFVLLLLVGLAMVWESLDRSWNSGVGRMNLRELSVVGQRFYEVIAGIQVSLVLLAAPAATAGAVCLDRARGTLSHMLVTDLSDGEIVLGKLAARLLPVFALVATAIPVLAIATLLGGIIPEAIATLSLVSFAVAVLGCALALAVSVRVLKTHEVLMAVYAFVGIWLLSAPMWDGISRSNGWPMPPDWFWKLNPFILTFAPYTRPGYLGDWDVVIFLAATLSLASALAFFSVRTLRREVAGPSRRSERWERRAAAVRARLFSWWPSPPLDGNPVLWREWHRNRPSRIAQRIWLVFWVASVLGLCFGVRDAIRDGVRNGPNVLVLTSGLHVVFGLLFLSVTGPTALSEERVRGSLDVLLATPLSTTSIVLGKWWGTYRLVAAMAVIPAIGALVFAAGAPELTNVRLAPMMPIPEPLHTIDRVAAALFPPLWVLAQGAMVTSVGLASATWISRQGRALVVSVLFYLFLTIGVVILLELVFWPLLQRSVFTGGASYILINKFRALSESALAVNPFGGQVVPLEAITSPWKQQRGWVWVVQAVTMAFTLAFSASVLGLTLLTFNDCLGRVDEDPRYVLLRPAPEAEPEPEPELVGLRA